MAKDYKGYSVKDGSVYLDKEYIRPVGGKYSIDGERLTIWELTGRISQPKEKGISTSPKKEKKVSVLQKEVLVHSNKPKQSIDTSIKPLAEVLVLRAHTKQTIDKIRSSLLANHHNRNACIFNGIEYPSVNQAAAANNTTPRTVTKWCRSGRNGCKFIPKQLG